MTVKELIAELEKLPPDLRVCYRDEEFLVSVDVATIEVKPEGIVLLVTD